DEGHPGRPSSLSEDGSSSLKWREEGTIEELRESLSECLRAASSSTLFSRRLTRRLLLLKRFWIAQVGGRKEVPSQQAPSKATPAPFLLGGQELTKCKSVSSGYVDATDGLARLGSRAALSFAFAFLKRAWRSGDDTDLCSELLIEALDVLRTLPPASLFYEDAISPVWWE
ncbi:Uncharacterized protein FKW44_002487, partial [Caligus rogercresseyi]